MVIAKPKQLRLACVAVLVVCVLFAMVPSASAQPVEPILRVETGMHVDQIKDVAVSPDGLALATASDDKTLRLWELATGELIDTFRIPISKGNEGLLFTTAFAPTGSMVVTGGISGVEWDRRSYVYFFRRSDGGVRFRFPVPGAVQKLSYFPKSGDPKYLAIAYSSRSQRGVMVIDARGQKVLDDVDYGGRPTWVEFANDGRLATVAGDGLVRVYSADLTQKISQKLPHGSPNPSVVRFSPRGSYLAVGYFNVRGVDVLASNNLTRLGALSITLPDGLPYVNAVAWRDVGEGFEPELFAGGAMARADGQFVVRRWRDFRDVDAFQDIPVSRDAIATLEATPSGEIVFVAGEPSWGVIRPDGTVRYTKRNLGSDNRDIYDGGLQLSRDGTSLEFRYTKGDDRRFFRFDSKIMTADPIGELSDASAGWIAPKPPSGLEGWRNSQRVRLNGREIPLLPNEFSRSADTLTGGRTLLGTDFSIKVLDASGDVIASREMASSVRGVVAAGDRAVAALADGRFRWFSLDPGRELQDIGALYFADRQGWVAWLPDGRFAHSSNGGEDLVGYHINRDAKSAARWVEMGLLYRRYHNPSAVRALLGRVPESELRGVVEASITSATDLLASRTPPEIEITELCYTDPSLGEVCHPAEELRRGVATRGLGQNPNAVAQPLQSVSSSANHYRLPSGVEAARVTAVAKLEGEPKTFDVLLNNRTTSPTTRGLGQRQSTVAERSYQRTLALADGDNEIVASIQDEAMEARSRPIFISVDREVKREPRLYALLVGIDDYTNVRPLRQAGADAEKFAELLADRPAEAFSDVDVTLLTNAEATEERVLAELEALAGKTTTADSVVVYLAGHGWVTEASQVYTFITVDGGFLDGPDAEPRGLAEDELKEKLGKIKSRNMFVTLDTCHAGAFDTQALSGGLERETGFHILAASSSEQEAVDRAKTGNLGLVMTAFDEVATVVRGDELTPWITVDRFGNHAQSRITGLAQEKGRDQIAHFNSNSAGSGQFYLVKPLE